MCWTYMQTTAGTKGLLTRRCCGAPTRISAPASHLSAAAGLGQLLQGLAKCGGLGCAGGCQHCIVHEAGTHDDAWHGALLLLPLPCLLPSWLHTRGTLLVCWSCFAIGCCRGGPCSATAAGGSSIGCPPGQRLWAGQDCCQGVYYEGILLLGLSCTGCCRGEGHKAGG